MKTSKKSIELCKERIDKLISSSIKGTWTPEEDNLILKYHSKFGRNWSLIAKKIEGRNGKQVRERFVNYLEKKEELFKDEFTEKEDDLIIKYFDLYPHNWNEISKNIPAKSAAQIKKRYVNHLRSLRLESTNETSGG